MAATMVALFDFFKRVDKQYPRTIEHKPPPPKPTDWQEGLWDKQAEEHFKEVISNSEAFYKNVASATTNVDLSTQLNEGNVMNYVALISTLISTIKAVEAMLPSSTGKEKLDVVVATVEGIFGEVSSILPQLTQLISVIVAGFNKLGVFTKKTA